MMGLTMILDTAAGRKYMVSKGDKEGGGGEQERSSGGGGGEHISEPVCTYPARIFVKYELMYLNVCAKKYEHIRTGYVHTYVQDTSLYVCDTDMSVLKCQYHILTCQYHIRTASI